MLILIHYGEGGKGKGGSVVSLPLGEGKKRGGAPPPFSIMGKGKGGCAFRLWGKMCLRGGVFSAYHWRGGGKEGRAFEVSCETPGKRREKNCPRKGHSSWFIAPYRKGKRERVMRDLVVLNLGGGEKGAKPMRKKERGGGSS